MAKVAKKKQTDYSIGGHDISQTAIPLYQTNLGRIDEYLANPQVRLNQYLSDYYDNNTATSDFLRNYKQAMADQVAQNYAATTGGYTSTGQRAYDQRQRDWSDAMARLRDQGVSSAYNMANQDYQNMLAGNNSYYNAYGLGKEYSDIDQYNYMAGQNNSFWNQALGIGGGLMSSAGQVLSAIPTPITQGIGAGLQTAGGVASNLTINPNLGASTSTQGVGTIGDIYGGTNRATILGNTASAFPNSLIGTMFKGRK